MLTIQDILKVYTEWLDEHQAYRVLTHNNCDMFVTLSDGHDQIIVSIDKPTEQRIWFTDPLKFIDFMDSIIDWDYVYQPDEFIFNRLMLFNITGFDQHLNYTWQKGSVVKNIIIFGFTTQTNAETLQYFKGNYNTLPIRF